MVTGTHAERSNAFPFKSIPNPILSLKSTKNSALNKADPFAALVPIALNVKPFDDSIAFNVQPLKPDSICKEPDLYFNISSLNNISTDNDFRSAFVQSEHVPLIVYRMVFPALIFVLGGSMLNSTGTENPLPFRSITAVFGLPFASLRFNGVTRIIAA